MKVIDLIHLLQTRSRPDEIVCFDIILEDNPDKEIVINTEEYADFHTVCSVRKDLQVSQLAEPYCSVSIFISKDDFKQFKA